MPINRPQSNQQPINVTLGGAYPQPFQSSTYPTFAPYPYSIQSNPNSAQNQNMFVQNQQQHGNYVNQFAATRNINDNTVMTMPALPETIRFFKL